MKFYFYYDGEGRVASYSDSSMKTDILQEILLEIDDVTFGMLKQNYDLYIQDGKLVCMKSQRIIDEEKQQEIQDLKTKLREGTATDKDVQQILLNI